MNTSDKATHGNTSFQWQSVQVNSELTFWLHSKSCFVLQLAKKDIMSHNDTKWMLYKAVAHKCDVCEACNLPVVAQHDVSP